MYMRYIMSPFQRANRAPVRILSRAAFPRLGVVESGRRLPRDIQAAHNCREDDSVPFVLTTTKEQ
jgi:hypothetical protein